MGFRIAHRLRHGWAFVAQLVCVTLVAGLFWGLGGCAQSGGHTGTAYTGNAATKGQARRPGTTVVALDFVTAYENVPSEAYYPLDGLAGCRYSPEGTLIICDEKRGKVFGLDNRSQSWYEFDRPTAGLFSPVDVQVDGFKVLVLDVGSNYIYRFDISGAYQDRLLDVKQVDPASHPQASAFGVDRDGRMAIADVTQQQILLLDTFLNLNMNLSGPGSLDDQLQDPSGLTFLPDGSFLVSDRGNRRLCLYGRLGFFETSIGGTFDQRNPFVAPQGLDADRHGNVFVVDQGNGRIHVLDNRLKHAFSAGEDYALAGTPMGPVGVAVGPDETLAVTDRVRSAILIYRIVYE